MPSKLLHSEKGKSWTVRIVPRLRGRWGECRYDTREIILVQRAVKQGVERQVFLHEMIHKCCAFLDEDAVDQLATELDDGLTVMEM